MLTKPLIIYGPKIHLYASINYLDKTAKVTIGGDDNLVTRATKPIYYKTLHTRGHNSDTFLSFVFKMCTCISILLVIVNLSAQNVYALLI